MKPSSVSEDNTFSGVDSVGSPQSEESEAGTLCLDRLDEEDDDVDLFNHPMPRPCSSGKQISMEEGIRRLLDIRRWLDVDNDRAVGQDDVIQD